MVTLQITKNIHVKLLADSLALIFFLSMLFYIPYGLDKKGDMPTILALTGIVSVYYIIHNIFIKKSIFFIDYGILGKWNYRLMWFCLFVGFIVILMLTIDPRIISYKFFFEQILNIELQWPIRFAILTWAVWFSSSLIYNHKRQIPTNKSPS